MMVVMAHHWAAGSETAPVPSMYTCIYIIVSGSYITFISASPLDMHQLPHVLIIGI